MPRLLLRLKRRNTLPFLLRLSAAVAACGLLPGCATIGAPGSSRGGVVAESGRETSRAENNAGIFDRVAELVDRRYFDAEFQGVNWDALRERSRAEALAAPDDAHLYAAINGMLRELGDSHTRVKPPPSVDELPRPRTSTSSSVVVMTRETVPGGRDLRELDDGLVYLRFDRFDLSNHRWLKAQLRAHRSASGLIIDLRSNRGGMIVAAKLTAGQFFNHSVPMGTAIRRSGSEADEVSWQWLSTEFAAPVAILVDHGTCSSAEVFAHVLQYHDRAVLVGRTTAGAVLGSRSFRLPGGGVLQVSISDYRGLDGRRLEGVGVQPDVWVPIEHGAFDHGADPDLAAAIRVLRSGRG